MENGNPSNWRGLFEPPQQAARGIGGALPIAREEQLDDALDLDMAEYKPWVLQRGRTRPIMMLHLRRFEPRSGLWTGWQLAYSHLVAVEYTGERLLSLDFGQRQFIIEGQNLCDLNRHLQTGSVLMVQEFSNKVWPRSAEATTISAIRRMDGKE